MSRIGFVGMGKLAAPVSLAAEERGHEVVGYDINPDIEKYFSGELPYPHQEEYVQDMLKTSNIRIVKSIGDVVAHSDIVFCAIQTPHAPEYEGATPLPDTREDFNYEYLKQGVQDISKTAKELGKQTTLCVISTCLPGTYDREIKPHVGENVDYVYSPLYIAMGTVIDDYVQPEFNLIGVESESAAEKLEEYYKTINNAPTVRTDITTAEAIKVSYNTWITAKTVLANAWGEMAERMGLDFDDMKKAWDLSTKRLWSPRYTNAGMSDGGGCFPAGEVVMTERGMVPIEQIEPGTLVLTSDGTFQKVVKRWERDYDGELIIVGVRGLPKVRMTVEHPVMVRSDGRKIDSVKEGVKRGRWNTYFKIIDKLQPIKEVRADKLNLAHLIGMPYTKTVVSKKNYEDDYLKLAGWYLSEGSLELTNTTARISIHLHEKELKDSKEIEQLLRNLIINTNNKRGINRKITNVVNGNKRMVRMGNVGLGKRLHDDFGSGAADKLIPADILWGDLEMGKKLLWGLIRGDGHRSKRGVSYSTISQDLAWGVFILLHRLKLYPTLRVIPPRGIHKLAYEVRIRNGKNASELCKIVGWKPYEYDKQINTYADDGGSVWRHIRSLETEKYTGKVYNLWVEGDHTYVVSCGAVHNCHPRDNIALSYIAEQVGMSHNIWEDLMSARDDYESWHAEIAEQTARDNEQDLYILGRAFKPETNIEAGSPSKLMSSFIEMGHYHEEDMDKLPVATYFIGTKHDRYKDYKFPSGSTVIDPFGIIEDMDGVTVRRLGRK